MRIEHSFLAQRSSFFPTLLRNNFKPYLWHRCTIYRFVNLSSRTTKFFDMSIKLVSMIIPFNAGFAGVDLEKNANFLMFLFYPLAALTLAFFRSLLIAREDLELNFLNPLLIPSTMSKPSPSRLYHSYHMLQFSDNI